MAAQARRVVTGHDAAGKSVVLSDGVQPQDHPMKGEGIGADFIEIWNTPEAVPTLTSEPDGEPTARPFAIMPATGHLVRIIEIYPPRMGGRRTVMHRTRTLDYAVVIEGEIVLVLSDSEVVLGPGSVVVQRGTDHAWENRSDAIARMAFSLRKLASGKYGLYSMTKDPKTGRRRDLGTFDGREAAKHHEKAVQYFKRH